MQESLTKSLPDSLQSKRPSIVARRRASFAELEAELGAIELGAGGDG